MFVDWGQLQLVLSVLVPTAVYVVLVVQFIGIYVASAIYIAVFMAWLGKYPWLTSSPIAVGVPIVASS